MRSTVHFARRRRRHWYLHWIQQADAMLTGRNIRQFTVRTDALPLAVAAAAREAIRDVAPAMTITKVWTLEQQVEASIVRDRLLGMLSGFFAGLGLLLAAIGLYGVMAYTVARRTSEIGIRMAIGAEAGQIAGMVVREALVVIASGIAIGIIAALGFAQALATPLFQLKPNDLGTIVAVTTLTVVTSLVAAYIPSRRAARIQPTLALRAE